MRLTSLTLVTVAAMVVLFVSYRATLATHHANPHAILVPFAGTWAKQPEGEHPSNHHTPFGGQWAVDHYQSPPAGGVFRWAPHYAGSTNGRVILRGEACADPNLQGGIFYRVAVENSTYGTRGWVLYAHVSKTNPLDGAEYLIPVGTVLGNGHHLGWVKQWPMSACYFVSQADGNHWHIEMLQHEHHSCFIKVCPNRP